MSAILISSIVAQDHNEHELPEAKMQHGFILSHDDAFATHLVASGPHSRQVDLSGQLVIEDIKEKEVYIEKKIFNSKGKNYFLLQAQNVDLKNIKQGQVLQGHIIESEVGTYGPRNIIVQKAKFLISKIFINIDNPFFITD